MNIILITKEEKEQGLDHLDTRIIHIKSVLKKEIGEKVLLGIENEPTIWEVEILEENEKIFFVKEKAHGNSPHSTPLTLVLGLSRPLVMKRLLKDASSLGVKTIHLVKTELGEKSYLQSSLWQGEHLNLLKEGAIQARTTFIPEIAIHENLGALFRALGESQDSQKWLLHLDEKTPHLLRQTPSRKGVILAIGSERGWTEREVELFTAQNFSILSMGKRVLRTETATLASLYWVSEELGMA